MHEEAGVAIAAQQAQERSRKAADEQPQEATNTLAKERVRRLQEDTDSEAVTTSLVDVAAAKRCVHVAITGCVGSGKSSLFNALLGSHKQDVDASPVEVSEKMTRYSGGLFRWYVAPGTRPFDCRDWQYFHDHHLYAFDCIIILFDRDNSFIMTDIAVLAQARSYNIPTFIVCSKADHHINSIMPEMGRDNEGNRAEEEDVVHPDELYEAAREHFVEDIRRKVRDNLEDANLPNQRLYIVSSSVMLGIMLNTNPRGEIDEADLLRDLHSILHGSHTAGSGEHND